MTHEYNSHKSVSIVLTEVRTILKRAETAMRIIEDNPEFEVEDGYWAGEWPNMYYVEPITIEHPNLDHMIKTLEYVTKELDPYRRELSRRKKDYKK